MSSRFAAAPCFLLVLALASAPAAGEGGGKTDDGKPRLTPFEWKKTSLDTQADAPSGKGPKLKLAPPAASNDDELVCEKGGVVHPTKVPGTWGVRHCWKKSDPRKIIERPFNFMTAEDMQDAAKAAAGFPPLKKPRRPAVKTKPAKEPAPAAAPAAVPGPAPAVTPAVAPAVDLDLD